MVHTALLRSTILTLDPLSLRRLTPPPAGDDSGAGRPEGGAPG